MRQSLLGHVSRLGLGASVALLFATVGSATAAPVPKVTICHVPPGNPAAVQLITVGAPAVPAHLAQHGDATCLDGDSDCCADADGAVCTNLQDDPSNCGACGTVCPSGQTCTAGACVATSTCPFIAGPACFVEDCFDFGGECCWVDSGFVGADAALCQFLDSCSPGGFGLGGGFCYEWSDCSTCPATFPPWP